jgi:hypothetical protein
MPFTKPAESALDAADREEVVGLIDKTGTIDPLATEFKVMTFMLVSLRIVSNPDMMSSILFRKSPAPALITKVRVI